MNNTYDNLYNSLKADSTIKNNYDIVFFSYDWRMSNTTSANALNSFIIDKNYGKVTLIAHSMGGLVASAYLALGAEQQSKLEKLFYLASPLLGTPEMANILGRLDFSTFSGGSFNSLMSDVVNLLLFFVTFNPDSLRNLLCNYQSVYELMPSEYYFSLANEFYIDQTKHI